MTEFDIGEEGQVLSLKKWIVLNGDSNVYLMPINECFCGYKWKTAFTETKSWDFH
jgi:hypothetical protein